jgi:hypothetical protein
MSSQPPFGDRSLLLVGESWFSHSVHQKGFDSFTTSTYEEGCADFVAALESRGWAVEHIPSHLVDARMPSTVEALRQHAVIALSDVGSNTFLLGRQTFVHGRVAPDLLELITAYTSGGGLVMVGGYMSFGGIDGKAGYGKTCCRRCCRSLSCLAMTESKSQPGWLPLCTCRATRPWPGSRPMAQAARVQPAGAPATRPGRRHLRDRPAAGRRHLWPRVICGVRLGPGAALGAGRVHRLGGLSRALGRGRLLGRWL